MCVYSTLFIHTTPSTLRVAEVMTKARYILFEFIPGATLWGKPPSVLYLQSTIYSWHSVRGARLWTVGGSWCRTRDQEEVIESWQRTAKVRTETKSFCCEVTACTFWTVLFRWIQHEDIFKMMCICFSIHSDIIIFPNVIYCHLHKTDHIGIL